MKTKDFISVLDLSPEQAKDLLKKSALAKVDRSMYAGVYNRKVMAMIFEKPSLRTRVTFETGLYQMGGYSIYLAPGDIRLGVRETVADIARNLDRWVDIIVARTFEHKSVVELGKYANIPVINALSDLEHPCQAMADFLTLSENFGDVSEITLAYVGDGNNVCCSLMLLSALLGTNFHAAIPDNYHPPVEVVEKAKSIAKESGSEIIVDPDPQKMIKDVQGVYTDTWISMGQEEETERRKRIFEKYQVNRELFACAASDAIVMHCMPAHRGLEITDEVIDSPQSKVFDQAENRLHVQKILMADLFDRQA